MIVCRFIKKRKLKIFLFASFRTLPISQDSQHPTLTLPINFPSSYSNNTHGHKEATSSREIGEIPFIVKIAKIERQKKRVNKWPRPKKNKLDFHPFLSKCIFFPLLILYVLTSGILLEGPFFLSFL